MKKVLLGVFAVSLVGSISLHAQEGCGTGRYNSEVFSDYTLTSDIIYGNNAQGSGDLKLDVYEPTGDSISQRPLIILAHGGSFISGTKTDDPAVTESCKRFAKMGYVTASIDYTLGFDQLPPNSEAAARTVYVTARELKTAVRFFRKDAATTNTYKINTDVIIIGGNSAGAIIALHTAYLDQYSELPAGVDTSSLGGIEGYEYGNVGYPSHVAAVVNMAGAIGDTTWMLNNTAIPVVSAHGDADGTVPYGSQTIVFLGLFPVMDVDGSGSINEFTTNHGMLADLLTFPGDDHCPWNSDAAKMTQMINHNRDFLFDIVCTYASVEENDKLSVNTWPNPASDILSVQLSEVSGNMNYKLVDMNGRVVLFGNKTVNNNTIQISVETLSNGLYTLLVNNGQSSKTAKVVVQK